MKKTVLILAAFLALSFASNAQKIEKLPNGNYKVIKATTEGAEAGKPTGKSIEDNGKVYPVLISSRGKLFYIRTSKTGTTYKKYIPE